MSTSQQATEAQRATSRLLFRERPVLGFFTLYALVFLGNSVIYDLVRLVHPVDYLREIERYTIPLINASGLYAGCFYMEKRRAVKQAAAGVAATSVRFDAQRGDAAR
jgi:hypothetical protein